MSLTRVLLEGSDPMILASLRAWRAAGIPFYTKSLQPPEEVRSSRRTIHRLATWCELYPLDKASMIVRFRDRDIELAILSASANAEIVV